MDRTGVIVTDGNERSTLAVTRSLGRRGIPVFVGAETVSSLAGASRYCAGSFVYPSPWREPEAYIARLLDAISERNAAMLFPMTDIAMELVVEHRQDIERRVALPIPTLEEYHRVSDKCRLIAWAEQEGIPTPPTIHVEDGDIDRVIDRIGNWPVVVKPGRSLLKVDGLWQKTSVMVAHNAAELRRLYRETWFLKMPSMIQRYIAGYGEGVFGIFADGHPVSLFAHRRLREFPPSGGVSVLREAIAPPQPMTDYAVRILQDAKWNGVAMVEFRIDGQSQAPYLMEVNGRFWGSLQLAVDAGADFPMMLYQNANMVAEPYRVGIRSRWWIGDLDHLLLRMKERRWGITPPPGSRARWRILLSLINPFDRRTRNEVLRLSDPKPGLRELALYVRAKIGDHGRSFGRRARNRGAMLGGSLSDGILTRRLRKMALPTNVTSVLIVCKGNICRSPFAERWLRAAAEECRKDLRIRSAGLAATSDAAADPAAETASRKVAIDLDGHCAQPVSAALVAEADIILAMEPGQVRQLIARFPDARGKTFLLGHFQPGKPLAEIGDPYGRSAEQFDECFAILGSACDGFLSRL